MSVYLLSEYLENSAFCDISLSVWTVLCNLIELIRNININIYIYIFLQHVNLIIRFLSSQLTLHIVHCLICVISVKKQACNTHIHVCILTRNVCTRPRLLEFVLPVSGVYACAIKQTCATIIWDFCSFGT
jgi:hypothetical protein